MPQSTSRGPDSLFPQDTYTVSQLGSEVRSFLEEAFFAVWVVGEVQRPRTSQRGHLYLELVEKGKRDEIVGKLDAVLWRQDHQRIRQILTRGGQQITDGQVVRCRGQIDFYAPAGRLQFVVREVDPVFTHGVLAQQRRQTIEALAAAGLLEHNRRLPLSPLPLRVGLITSQGSAAYHDFLSTLQESGYGFRVELVHVAVQGRQSERQVARALSALARYRIDCAVLVRGGGSRVDLAGFDSRRIAEAIARAPFPVLTGLGHEIDEAVADLVAKQAFKTPTKAAEFLVESVAKTEASLQAVQMALCRQARALLRRERAVLAGAGKRLQIVRIRLSEAWSRHRTLARSLRGMARERIRQADDRHRDSRRRLVETIPRFLSRCRREPESLARRIAELATARLRETRATCDGLNRLMSELQPRRTLERGFSLTRDSHGKLLRRADQVEPGEKISTELATGNLHSRVESS